MSKIRIANGPYRGREKTLADQGLTIGRDAEAGIQILDRSASRFHAEIFPVGGMYFVRDLDSKNGTYVNDDKIGDEELLREGDVIKIGSTELIYEAGTAVTDDESSGRISYRDDADVLSNTLEFRLDELSDISEPKEQAEFQENARSLRILYQIGRMLSDGGTEAIAEKEAKALDALVQSMPAECALIFRRELPSGRLVPSTVRTAAPGIQPVISRSIVKKTFSENKALHIANAQDDDRFDRNVSIVQKGIRSVICVPLAVASQVRGVLYLSRRENADPFSQIDLELVSAVAIQLGMAQNASEQQRRHREALWKALAALVRVLEARGPAGPGAGERCARVCSAIAKAMRLDTTSRDRLARAGLVGPIAQNDPSSLSAFDGIAEYEDVAPSVKAALKPSDELDTEAAVLAVALAFETRTAADRGVDVGAVVEMLRKDAALDIDIVTTLQGCHLDGSLYA